MLDSWFNFSISSHTYILLYNTIYNLKPSLLLLFSLEFFMPYNPLNYSQNTLKLNDPKIFHFLFHLFKAIEQNVLFCTAKTISRTNSPIVFINSHSSFDKTKKKQKISVTKINTILFYRMEYINDLHLQKFVFQTIYLESKNKYFHSQIKNTPFTLLLL